MTDNHNYTAQAEGAQDWHIPLNETIEELDIDVAARDTEANLSSYTPKSGARFIATDTGKVFDGDGTNWLAATREYSTITLVDSITWPDGSTTTTSPEATPPDIEDVGGVVVADAGAVKFLAQNAASVTVADDGDNTVTVTLDATDTNTQRTNEEIQDIVGSLVTGSDNVTTNYDDGTDTLTISGLTDEQIQDIVGTMAGANLTYDDGGGVLNAADTQLSQEEVEDFVNGVLTAGTNITKTYDDVGGTLTIDGLSTEELEDIVGAMAGTNLAYDDGTGLLNASDSQLTDEQVQDIVGPFVVGGTDITVTYDDVANTLTIDGTSTKRTDEEIQDVIGNILDSTLLYDDVTPSIGVADGSIAEVHLAFDPATQTEFNAHTGDAGAHHTRYTTEEAQDDVGGILNTADFVYNDTTPQISLLNDSVTVAGNTVSLGGSTPVDHADLSNITASQHHARYTAEEAQDDVGAIFGATLTYDDLAPSMNVASGSIGTTHLSFDPATQAEFDAHAGDVDAHHTRYTTEEAQDDVGGILSARFSYDDVTPGIDLAGNSITLGYLSNPFPLSDISDLDVGGNDLSDGATIIWNSSANAITSRINTTFANIDELLIPDKGIANRTVNGTLWREGNDVFAYVNGSEVHLSDIGSGGGGAPTDATYLTTADEAGLSAETVVDAYPFALATDTDMNVAGTDLVDGATVVWDTSQAEVPQSQLGGPAASLTAYPIPSSDLDTESFQDAVGNMAGTGITYDDANGQLDASSSGVNRLDATSNFTASEGDSLWIDASGSSVQITAPPPTDGGRFWVRADDVTNGVTITDNAGEQLIIGGNDYGGGQTDYSMTQHEIIGFESDGTDWKWGY